METTWFGLAWTTFLGAGQEVVRNTSRINQTIQAYSSKALPSDSIVVTYAAKNDSQNPSNQAPLFIYLSSNIPGG